MASVTFLLPRERGRWFNSGSGVFGESGLRRQVTTVQRGYIEKEELQYPVRYFGHSAAGIFGLRALEAPMPSGRGAG